MDEIRLLSRFRENNPVNKDSYERIIGDYWFPDEVKCCREEPNGQLCGEGHKWGFVAKLKDGSITIVGNYCARDKFGADAKIKADRSKYLNEKRRRERFAKLGDLLAEKDARIARLEVLGDKLKEIQERIRGFLESQGERIRRRLHDMARSSNPTVFVHAVTYRDYIDEDGEKRKERRTAPVRLGTLSGLSIIGEHLFQSLYSSMRAIKRSFDAAEAITEDVKNAELDLLINTISDIDRIEIEIGRVEKEERLFFGNDFSLLCFLVDDKPERYKAARVFLERSGEVVGKDKAKSWLSEKEQEIRKTLNADKIEIQY